MHKSGRSKNVTVTLVTAAFQNLMHDHEHDPKPAVTVWSSYWVPRSCRLFFTTAFGTSRSARRICFIPSKDGYYIWVQAAQVTIRKQCQNVVFHQPWHFLETCRNLHEIPELTRTAGVAVTHDSLARPQGMVSIAHGPGQWRNLQHLVRCLAGLWGATGDCNILSNVTMIYIYIIIFYIYIHNPYIIHM